MIIWYNYALQYIRLKIQILDTIKTSKCCSQNFHSSDHKIRKRFSKTEFKLFAKYTFVEHGESDKNKIWLPTKCLKGTIPLRIWQTHIFKECSPWTYVYNDVVYGSKNENWKLYWWLARQRDVRLMIDW